MLKQTSEAEAFGIGSGYGTTEVVPLPLSFLEPIFWEASSLGPFSRDLFGEPVFFRDFFSRNLLECGAVAECIEPNARKMRVRRTSFWVVETRCAMDARSN